MANADNVELTLDAKTVSTYITVHVHRTTESDVLQAVLSDFDAVLSKLTGWSCPWATHQHIDSFGRCDWATTRYVTLHG